MPAISVNTLRSSAQPSHSTTKVVPSSTSAASLISTSSTSNAIATGGAISTVYATATVTVSTPYSTASAVQNSRHGTALPAGIVAGGSDGKRSCGNCTGAWMDILGKENARSQARSECTCAPLLAPNVQSKSPEQCSTFTTQKGPYWRKPGAHTYNKVVR